MEVNKYSDIRGVVLTEDIKPGRMVKITSHTWDHNFGSRTDLPGVALPTSEAEAKEAFFMIDWALDNRSLPVYHNAPRYDWALRDGFDRTANLPMTAQTVLLTHASDMHTEMTINSGELGRAYGGGVFTVGSGDYVYSASMAPGSKVAVAYTDPNKGKFIHTTDLSLTVGYVEKIDTTNNKLTVRTLQP